MSRWRAAAIHLALSLPFLAVIGWLEARVWYPPPLLTATGADRVLGIAVGGCLALGPLLTLIAYKAGKSTLRSDLIVITVLQVAATALAAKLMFDNRPVYLVAVVDRVNLVTAAEFDPADLAEAAADYARFGWGAPRQVAAAVPTDPEQRSKLLERTIDRGTDIQVLPKYFVPYADQRASLLEKCRPLADLRKRDPGGGGVDRVLAGQPDEGACWLPLIHRKASLSLLISRQDAAPIGTVAIDPWQP